jgi:hypothetical protein
MIRIGEFMVNETFFWVEKLINYGAWGMLIHHPAFYGIIFAQHFW